MGKVIVLEGTDGCGKHTQSLMLMAYLKSLGKNVIVDSYPRYEEAESILVRNYLNGKFGGTASCISAKQATMFYAVDMIVGAMAWKDKLADSDTYIVLDRYITSNLYYQGVKAGDTENQVNEFFDWFERFAFSDAELPEPDIVLYLDANDEITHKQVIERGIQMDIHEKDTDYGKAVSKFATQVVCKEFHWSIIPCGIVKEDGSVGIKSISDITKLIVDELKSKKIIE